MLIPTKWCQHCGESTQNMAQKTCWACGAPLDCKVIGRGWGQQDNEPSTELLPCPFCGGKPYINRTNDGKALFIECAGAYPSPEGGCGARMRRLLVEGEESARANLIKRWNRRIEGSALVTFTEEQSK